MATTADVIHSFWVPELNRKIDMIPGLPNRILLDATARASTAASARSSAGAARAHGARGVRAAAGAVPSLAGATWPGPRRAAGDRRARAGERVFLSSPCASCHTIARHAGPGRRRARPDPSGEPRDAGRGHDPEHTRLLAAWIRNPQAIKPGVRMPDLGLSASAGRELVAYLETLR